MRPQRKNPYTVLNEVEEIRIFEKKNLATLFSTRNPEAYQLGKKNENSRNREFLVKMGQELKSDWNWELPVPFLHVGYGHGREGALNGR